MTVKSCLDFLKVVAEYDYAVVTCKQNSMYTQVIGQIGLMLKSLKMVLLLWFQLRTHVFKEKKNYLDLCIYNGKISGLCNFVCYFPLLFQCLKVTFIYMFLSHL